MRTANHSIQRMGASRSGQWQFVYQWWLAPTADAGRWAGFGYRYAQEH
jgi:hypothetical protein